MDAVNVAIGILLLINAAVGGLAATRRRPTPDRLVVILFTGTTTVAATLLFGQAADLPGTIDIALIAAVFSAFLPLTYARRTRANDGPDRAGRKP